MKKPRICLIVDNPLRDLDGMVLLGWTLAQQGAEVFLVPMYQQVTEIAALMPDLVLFNYSRANNKDLIRICSESGILVGVLDTEGGVFTDVEEKLINIVAKSYPEYIDLYCLWGQRQYDSFVSHKILPEDKLRLTGCPRFDFCVEPWRSALPRIGIDGKPMILVNTCFPNLFPRFQRCFEDEINISIQVGLDETTVRESARQCCLVWAEMINAVAGLAESFPEAIFVIRPHPFESQRIYDQLFKTISNIKVIQKGTSMPWVNSALLLIQRNCSTAIEANLLDVETVSLEWINAQLLRNEMIAAVSEHANSKEDLFKKVEDKLKGKHTCPTNSVKEQRDRMVDDWFCAIDGKSSDRVANAIMETISTNEDDIKKQKLLKILTYQGFTKSGIKSVVRFLCIRVLGLERYYKLKGSLLKQPDAHSKTFRLNDVQVIVDRLSGVKCDAIDVTVEKVKNKHCRLKMVAQSSIRLACQKQCK